MIFKILKRLYNIDHTPKSKILIYGKELTRISNLELRGLIGYLSENPILVTGTVRDNLDPYNKHSDIKIFSLFDEFNIIKILKVENSETRNTNSTIKWKDIEKRELFYLELLKYHVGKNSSDLPLELTRALNLIKIVLDQVKILIIEENSLITSENSYMENFEKITQMSVNMDVLVVSLRYGDGVDLCEYDEVLRFEDGELKYGIE